MLKRILAAMVLTGLAALFLSCRGVVPPTPPPTVVVQQNQQVIIGVPSPAPSPGQAGACQPGAVDEVRVGIFGQVCPNGKTPPNNAARTILIGCTAAITATPKLQGVEVKAEVHGTAIDWNVFASAPGVLEVQIPPNNFNRDAKGLGSGTGQFSAKVCGITGLLDVTVQP